jgi:hypothetical protein
MELNVLLEVSGSSTHMALKFFITAAPRRYGTKLQDFAGKILPFFFRDERENEQKTTFEYAK